MSNLCQVDGQINVGEMQMTKFSSNRPVKSILTAGQSLVKRALGLSLEASGLADIPGIVQ